MITRLPIPSKGAMAIAKWFPFWGGFCPMPGDCLQMGPKKEGPKFIQCLAAKQMARVKAVGDNGRKWVPFWLD